MSELLTQLGQALAGKYEIDRELGRGGMATVYLARDLKHHRQVAVKVLNEDLGAVLGVERFLGEIRVTAHLQHPNLLPLFDSGDAGGRLFYVMPYVDGESLRSRLDREKQLPVSEVVRIAVAVASALDYAHRQGVIHRDLKPENNLRITRWRRTRGRKTRCREWPLTALVGGWQLDRIRGGCRGDDSDLRATVSRRWSCATV